MSTWRRLTARLRPKREGGAGRTDFQAEEQPDQGLRGQNTEPLCLELVKFAEGTTVGRGERRNGGFTLRARGSMGDFRAGGTKCCLGCPETGHPVRNAQEAAGHVV